MMILPTRPRVSKQPKCEHKLKNQDGIMATMPGRSQAPSLPGDKRPLISDEASAATAGTEPGKVLLLNPHEEQPSLITKPDKLPMKKYRLKPHVKIGHTCSGPGCRLCGIKVAKVF